MGKDEPERYAVYVRKLLEVSPEKIWSEWEQFDSGLDKETAQRRLDFFREANDSAVSYHGEAKARCEFKAEEEVNAVH